MTTVIQTGSWPGWSGPVSVELADDAAVALFSAVAAYRQETGRHDADVDPIVMPVGGLRTVAECAEMAQGFDLHRVGKSGWQAIYQKYNMDPASTARPSTSSPHVSGYCADIAPNAFLSWMVASGQRFGWRRTLVASNDLRHFQYFPGTATAALNVTSLDGSTSSGSAPRFPIEEFAMAQMLGMNRTQDNVAALFDGTHWQEFSYTSNSLPGPGGAGGQTAVKQYQIDFIIGMLHSVPVLPYDAVAWDYRSNKLPAMKQPLFVDNGTSIVPVTEPVSGGSVDVSHLATKDDVSNLSSALGQDIQTITKAIAGIPAAVVSAIGALFGAKS